jgi:2-oxoglutarate dehydrogenase E1 component
MTRQDVNRTLLQTSFLYGANSAYIEALHAKYERDPLSVEPGWRDFFAALGDDPESVAKTADGASWRNPNWPQIPNGDLINALDGDWPAIERAVAEKVRAKAIAAEPAVPPVEDEIRRATRDSVRALMMIRAYRMRGHLHANLDPLGLEPQKDHEELHPATYGFHETEYDHKIFIDHVLGLEYASVREMLAILRRTYCGTIGFEFIHISDPAEKAWIQERIEGPDKEITFTKEGKRAILSKLVEAEGFEGFFDVKYPGAKRFGLDGGEAMIPALEQIIKRGGQLGLRDICLGMAHRGRLNVLSQVMGKPHRVIFHEFKGGSASPDEVEGSGDVKYHLGASSDREFDGNSVHLSLTANPSHLEIVDPVVLGKARAKQDQLNDIFERAKVLPLLIHGDAAFAGQGVVAECFGLSGLRGHRTGGSLHFIVNNQIGFTTYPRYSRSSPYPSDVAKLVEAPIFHVNGDDPEAVVFCAKVAIEYRQKFHKPVVIDMFCYRRFGHNEGDEPSFTQPIMYRLIRSHPTTLQIYSDKLIAEGVVTRGEVDKMRGDWRHRLEAEYEAGQAYLPNKADWLDKRWSGFRSALDVADDDRRGETGVNLDRLRQIGERITAAPEGFNVHKTILRFLDNRRAAIKSGEAIDWSTAEALAFGTLLDEGFPVRLSGQDSERGTFSQRHSVLIDQQNEARYIPLNHIRDGQARYEVINSMLSEEAVLGFEYGYSLAEPNALTVWEAQFGDFANGAQVVFDQFISAGERKWLRMSGLVCMLPHGYEGQGPEHSSARLERYLQLCAEDNMQVVYCTTPANLFHALRRQLKRKFRKPLIAMTPKSMLRNKRAVSMLDAFGPGTSFHRLLWDHAETHGGEKITLAKDDKIRRVVLCSGKVYYDLYEEREKRGVDDVYLLRIEQLYPFPLKALIRELSRFKKAEIVWCQEEPKNMGSWFFVEPYLEWVLGQVGGKSKRARYSGRPAAAATATGLMSKHLAQLKAFVDECLA